MTVRGLHQCHQQEGYGSQSNHRSLGDLVGTCCTVPMAVVMALVNILKDPDGAYVIGAEVGAAGIQAGVPANGGLEAAVFRVHATDPAARRIKCNAVMGPSHATERPCNREATQRSV